MWVTGGWDHKFLFTKPTGKSGGEGRGQVSGPDLTETLEQDGCDLRDLDFQQPQDGGQHLRSADLGGLDEITLLEPLAECQQYGRCSKRS